MFGHWSLFLILGEETKTMRGYWREHELANGGKNMADDVLDLAWRCLNVRGSCFLMFFLFRQFAEHK